MGSRETKTLKFHVPNCDVDSPMGRPLKKVPKTQAHSAAHNHVRHLNREPSQGSPRGNPPSHLGALLTCASASLLPDLPPLGASE